ncbi:MAG: HD domain-containing protein [Candidatus ainarchaeum sp.]|nr:HD domain-containing protein [Candidatus ainarchaeum sp.]
MELNLMPKNSLLGFFETINKLKHTKRTGWVLCGVKNAESVAEHSFRVAVMAFFLAKKLKCNSEKLVKMCLLHDLHESISGDLILDYSKYGEKLGGLGKEEKAAKEKKAFEELTQIIGQKDSKGFRESWLEFEEGKTKEAIIAKELDVLEMMIQVAEYQKNKNFEIPLWPIWIKENRGRIKNPELKKILSEIEKQMV